jgi:hypothetical protein
MRRAFALLAAAVLATGWSVAVPMPASASCAFVAVRHDRAYFAYWGPHHLSGIRPGGPLSGTLQPGCSDVGGAPSPGPTRVGARRIAGVPAEVALLVQAQALVAVGYLPQARGFPFHGPVVDELKRCRLGDPLSLTGIARARPGGLNLAHVRATGPVHRFEHQLVDLFVDVHTKISRLSRHGLPYIGDGQRVRIDAVHCGRKIVARHIVPAGRIAPETSAEDILGPDWRGGPSVESSAHRHGWWAFGTAAVTAALAGGVLVRRRRPGAPHRS